MRSLLLAACFGAALVSGAAAQDAREDGGGASASVPPLVTLPFELNSNKVYFEVGVGGSQHWFVLDTGAPTTFVDQALAEKLGLVVEAAGASEGLGNQAVSMGQAHDVALSLGTLALPPQDVGVLPLDAVLRSFEGRRVAGLIGNDIIARYLVEIDYDHRRLRWYEASGPGPQWSGRSIPVDFAGQAFLKARLTPVAGAPIEARLLLDIGVRNALMLYAPFVARHDLLPRGKDAVLATVGCGIGGEVRGHVGRLERCEVGGFSLALPIATFASDTEGLQATTDYDGILGAELIRRFRVQLDFSHGRVALEPGAAFTTPFEFDMSGLFVIAEGDDLRTFRVHRVIDGSPAAEAQVREGDEIVAVGEQPAAQLTLEALRQLLIGDGAVRVLDLRRGGESLQVTLTLRPIVRAPL